MPLTDRPPLPDFLFKPIVCTSRDCKQKGEPLVLPPDAPADLDNLLNSLFESQQIALLHAFCLCEARSMMNKPGCDLEVFVLGLIKAGSSPEEVRAKLLARGEDSGTAKDPFFDGLTRFVEEMVDGYGEDQPLDSMKATAHLLMVLNESSTCLHEFYLNAQHLPIVASYPEVVLSQAYERADFPTTTFKSIRKLPLSKSTTSTQKLTWRRAGDWEGLLSRTIKLVVRQTVDRPSQRYITTSIFSTNMKKLFTVLSSPMHLFAVVLADLDASNTSKSYPANFDNSLDVNSRHLWGKDVLQIITAVTMEGGLESYLLSDGVDQDKIAEIEKKRDGLVAKVEEISKEIEDLEAQLLLLKVPPSSAKKESGPTSLPTPIAKSTLKSTARSSKNPVTTPAYATSTSQPSASFAGTSNRFPAPAPTSSPASNSRNAPAESGTAKIPSSFRFQPTLNPHVFKAIEDGSVKYYLINSVQRGEAAEILLNLKPDDEMAVAFRGERATWGTPVAVADAQDCMRECVTSQIILTEQLRKIIEAGTTYSAFVLAQAAALAL